MKKMADQLLSAGPRAEVVARRTLRLARKGRLYALPMWDGWLGWCVKRAFPWALPTLLATATRWAETYHSKRAP